MHEGGRHRHAGKSIGQPRQLGVQRCERRRVRLGRALEERERRRHGAVGEVRRPEQPERLDELVFTGVAGHRQTLEMLHPLEIARRRAPVELDVELRLAAVAHSAERVDRESGSDALGVRREQMQEQVAAPGVPCDDGLLPPEAVEHGHDVGDLGRDVVGRAGRRGRKAALLVDRHAVAGGKLHDERLKVRPFDSRSSVQQEHGRTAPHHRAAEPPTVDADLEGFVRHLCSRSPPRSHPESPCSPSPASAQASSCSPVPPLTPTAPTSSPSTRTGTPPA